MAKPVEKSKPDPADEIDPVAHAKWLVDAIEASKQALEHAKTYKPLSKDELAPVEIPERALSFIRKIAGPTPELRDTLLAAAQYHMAPDDYRALNHEIESSVAIEDARKIVREFDAAEQELHLLRFSFESEQK